MTHRAYVTDWVDRQQAAQMLGVHLLGITMLIHHKVAPPDCIACGRIRWPRDDIEERRDELRGWVQAHHPEYVLN